MRTERDNERRSEDGEGGAEARSVDDNEEDNKDKLRCVLPALE